MQHVRLYTVHSEEERGAEKHDMTSSAQSKVNEICWESCRRSMQGACVCAKLIEGITKTIHVLLLLQQRTICDAQAILELGFNAQLIQPDVDFWSTAMHKHCVNAHTGKQHQIIYDSFLQTRPYALRR